MLTHLLSPGLHYRGRAAHGQKNEIYAREPHYVDTLSHEITARELLSELTTRELVDELKRRSEPYLCSHPDCKTKKGFNNKFDVTVGKFDGTADADKGAVSQFDEHNREVHGFGTCPVCKKEVKKNFGLHWEKHWESESDKSRSPRGSSRGPRG
ncbi:hypothetical protein DFP72DRAFT_848541 [Ephemerocybe angulata]|uniref:Uncharacterized protein n=1 Tax=Ephemerocybe angulata TaxID=980116 RepID=A0A8H6M5N3_9AGAR|nr:hypothetical protein DFP72DRAFT_848541 [Tulosesus angulatus]